MKPEPSADHIATERALHRSEERFREFAELLPEIIFEMDADGGLTFVNQRALEITGYSQEDFDAGIHWSDIIIPEDRERAFRNVQAILRGKEKGISEYALLRKDGSTFPIMVRSTAILRDGKPDGLRGIFFDITERKRTERALRDNEALLQSILRSTPVGIGVVTHRVVSWMNEKFSEISGYSSEELVGQSSRIIYPDEEEYDSVGKQLLSQIGECGTGTIETRFKRKDGKIIDVVMRTTPIDSDDLSKGIVFTALDITSRKQTAAALRESEEKFRSVIQSSPMGMFAYQLEPDGKLIFSGWNPAANDILGVDCSQFLGKTIEEAFPPLAQTEVPHRYRLAAAEGISWQTEQIDYEDEQFRGAYEVHAFQTAPMKMALFFRDITDRKRAERERKGLEKQLRQSQKMEAIGRLAGGVAHDFNNILTGINGYAELLLSSLSENDPIHRDIEEIKKAGTRAADLIQQLLAFSRRQAITPRVLEPDEIIASSERMLRRIIGEHIELIHIPRRETWCIKVDPAQIDQVLINLAINGRDAMPDGGRLTIETQNVTRDQEFCRLHPGAKSGEFVMITISDEGHGMDEDTQRLIFEPFFSTKDKDKGTGLGLATVYGIVKQNDGYISVNSKIGAGTTFKIYFPRTLDQLDRLPPERPSEPPSGTETILLVEDENLVRELARRILELRGYSVLEAANGGEAYLLSKKHGKKIHLLLSDVVMPKVNGFELYEQIREINPELRAVFMSGHHERFLPREGVSKQDTRFIQKPFTIEALAATVRELLDS